MRQLFSCDLEITDGCEIAKFFTEKLIEVVCGENPDDLTVVPYDRGSSNAFCAHERGGIGHAVATVQHVNLARHYRIDTLAT